MSNFSFWTMVAVASAAAIFIGLTAYDVPGPERPSELRPVEPPSSQPDIQPDPPPAAGPARFTAPWLGLRLAAMGMDGENPAAILDACRVNGCWRLDRLALLLAIRRHENGRPGLEWGYGPGITKYGTYRAQAGGCAFQINKFLTQRDHRGIIGDADIRAFGARYCPEDRPEAWVRNVTYWYHRAYALLQDPHGTTTGG